MVNFIKGKDLICDIEKYDVILVGTSIYCMLTGGIQSKLRFKYPILEIENDKTPYGDSRKLGKRLTFNSIKPCISLMYICTYPHSNKTFIDYEALRRCLMTANSEFSGLNVASTVIGTSRFDGNGDKNECLRIIEETTNNLNLTLYDYVQKSRREEINEYKKYIYSFKKLDREKYKQMIKEENNILKKHYLA